MVPKSGTGTDSASFFPALVVEGPVMRPPGRTSDKNWVWLRMYLAMIFFPKRISTGFAAFRF
jgi:hypothetical protein